MSRMPYRSFFAVLISLMITLCEFLYLFVGVPIILLPSDASATCANNLQEVGKLIGKNDSILIADAGGNIVFGKNDQKKLIPASTFKIFTAILAIHCLKENFRFPTEFYIDDKANLTIKGYGDPLLISENVKQIADILSHHISTVNNIYLDDSYFKKPIKIPGVTKHASDPYNAPNGALCVNFNTINFTYKNNQYLSAEPQTPLLSIAKRLAKKSGLKSGRITIFNNNNEITYYAGQLFTFFLKNSGVKVKGDLHIAKVNPEKDHLIFRYLSGFELKDDIARLLTYSNNYIANQIFLAIGARQYGPPATLEKGVRVAEAFAKTVLNLKDMTIVEGSGISRHNRISAMMFLKILNEFSPYYTLMRHQGNEYYKTGTLDGIRTRVGYIQTKKDGLYRYVVMLNTPGKITDPIMAKIRQCLY